MKNILFIIISLIVLSGCSNKDKPSKFLQETAKSLNDKCPMQVDPLSVMESCEALPGNTLKYSYIISKPVADTIAMKNMIKRKTLYTISSNPQIKTLRDANTTFLYSYKGEDNKDSFSFLVTPDEYNNKQVDNRSRNEKVAELISDAAIINKMLAPITLDEYTRLVNYQFAAPDTAVIYNEITDNEMTIDDLNLQIMKGSLIRYISNDPSATEYKDYDVVFKYIYKFKNGENCQIIVSPQDYK